MPRLPRRGMFFHVFSCRFVSFCCRAGPCRIMSWRAVSWRVVSFRAVLRGRRRAGLRRLRAESGRFSRRPCGCRMGSGQADAGPGFPAGSTGAARRFGLCGPVRRARMLHGKGPDVVRAVRCCLWCGFARDGWPGRRGNGSVQGVRRGGDCECRLYSLSLPRSAAGKCMAAAFRKDFGP